MTNAMTGKPLRVEIHPNVYPILELPRSQVPAVRQLLDRHAIPYEVSEWFLSMDGGPEKGQINFSWKVDGRAVQALLDASS